MGRNHNMKEHSYLNALAFSHNFNEQFKHNAMMFVKLNDPFVKMHGHIPKIFP